MKTILCIIRASTIQQETQSQRDELVEFCKLKGFTEDEMEFIEVAGASARKCNPQYLNMLSDIKSTILNNPSIKNVALWHLNRLGRVESKLHEMKEFFVRNHIQVFIKEPSITLLDENGEISAAGSITFSVYASMVKYETDEMFAKMKRGKERNKAKGLFTGGNLKFGYSLTEGNNIIINPEEAAVVRLVFELYATSKFTVTELADELNERGVTKYDNRFDYYRVFRILRDDSFTGHQSKNNMKWPEIISRELFEKCRKIRDEHAIIHVPTKEYRHVNLAIGLLKCHCGNNYIANGGSYRCYSKCSRNKTGCDSPGIRVDVVDSILILLAKYAALSDLMKDNSVSKQEIEKRIEVANQKLNTCIVEKQKLSERKNRLQDDYYVEGNMSEAQYQKRISAIDAKILGNEKKMESLKDEIATANASLSNMNSVSDAEKLFYSIWELNWNVTDIAVRKRIKNIVTENFSEMKIEEIAADGRKQKDILITVKSRNGYNFIFKYSTYLKNFKHEKCPIFMAVSETDFKAVLKPIDNPIFSGSMEYNPEILDVIRTNYGIPKISSDDFQKILDKYYIPYR